MCTRAPTPLKTLSEPMSLPPRKVDKELQKKAPMSPRSPSNPLFLVHDARDVSHFIHQPREGKPPDLPDANVERVFAVCVGATEEHDDTEDDVADEGEEGGGDGAATVVGVIPARGTT